MIPSKKKKVHQRVRHYTLSTTHGSSMRFATGVPARQLTTSYVLKRKL